ncbi:DNA primase [Candidatus Dojkabacteria bacterium]|nr:DNA primase [Candidatus Dojkabacteria bacterium]
MAERSQIDEIKEKLNIVDVIQAYIPNLKKSGSNFFTLCPFHNEKTPSFSINPDLGIYKCFGCGEAGDVITFIEKIEGVDFPEAVEIAAEKAGIRIKKVFSKADKEKQGIRKRIIEANELSVRFFGHALLKHRAGKKAREYVKARKIETREIENFRIGYAPESFNSLMDFLLKKKFSEKELVSFGLLVSKNGRIYDKFRGRLMFPIFNTKGEVAGFSGRIIDKDALGPKYLNSPETIMFNKSSLVYGLFQSREAIRKENFVIISEGQIDVLSSHKEGVGNIVAPLGTSLTEIQLKALKRYCDSIYFSFDTDLAGEKALLRSVEVAQKTGFEVKAINLGKFTDADELIRQYPGQWPIVVQKAEPVIEHMVRRLSKRINLGEAKGKAEFAKIILPMIDSLTDRIQQSHYIKKISVIIDTDEEVLREELDRFRVKTEKKEREEEQEGAIFLKRSESLSREEYLAALVLQNADYFKELNNNLTDINEIIKNTNIVNILTLFREAKNLKILSNKLGKNEKSLFEKLILMPISIFNDEDEIKNEFAGIVKNLRMIHIREEINAIKKKINEIDAKGEDTENLVRELDALSKKLKSC